jgi:hypothetical protein
MRGDSLLNPSFSQHLRTNAMLRAAQRESRFHTASVEGGHSRLSPLPKVTQNGHLLRDPTRRILMRDLGRLE